MIDKNKQKLISFLQKSLLSGSEILINKDPIDENTLQYLVNGEYQTIEFENLGEEFWPFVYQGICEVAPNAIVEFMNVNAFGEEHISVIINLNEQVSIGIINREHIYDDFIFTLKEKLEGDKELEITEQSPFTLSRKIKKINF